jgi:hypothetical protein
LIFLECGGEMWVIGFVTEADGNAFQPTSTVSSERVAI